ncbi:MAG: mannose-1-phosphate guanylyltransferase/mannose-6-phosphate isomerase [Gammaproteobacteria bacterium]|nr:mannose-1-phosphate guanylyltransferase/mannose-6-phosphate isomerase [Gammaproteobacteria bacterium]
MTDTRLVPVILSGGTGSRLWPLSRAQHPKQFIALGHATLSMLQATAKRLQACGSQAPIVVCNHEHRFMVAEQLRGIDVPAAAIVLEPVGRNTAPAIAVAALEAIRDDQDPLLLVSPADHVIDDDAAFSAALRTALPAARDGNLVTFGVTPTRPETGYGYIKASGPGAAPVASFVEKPDLATAEQYLASGDYYWNSGMFLFRASVYLRELQHYAPEILAACQAAHAAIVRDLDFLRLDEAAFAGSPSDSIDYAVMEKTERAYVVPLAANWSDVGAWDSLWSILDKDDDGNAVRGDVVLQESKNCYVHAEHRLVTVVGAKDQIIVETADAVLVASRSHAQDVKHIVDRLKTQQREEVTTHKRVYRPWGYYESIDGGERFQAKRISVNPQCSLSLQMHHHRAEHWIVVSGTARITRGNEKFLLAENESTYIPVATRHRLENPGTIPLEIIEVQSGSYLGEDDIVRFEDAYGREGRTD